VRLILRRLFPENPQNRVLRLISRGVQVQYRPPCVVQGLRGAEPAGFSIGVRSGDSRFFARAKEENFTKLLA